MAWGEIVQQAEARVAADQLGSWAARVDVSWERYGSDLFDVLDVRRPDLWQEFREFRRNLAQAIRKSRDAGHGQRAQTIVGFLVAAYEKEIV